jgi:hypothetical protein
VDLPTQRLPTLSAGAGPGVPQSRWLICVFSSGVGPHAFSIGLGCGHSPQLSNTSFLARKIPRAASMQNMIQSTLFIGPHISFPSHLLSSRSVVTIFPYNDGTLTALPAVSRPATTRIEQTLGTHPWQMNRIDHTFGTHLPPKADHQDQPPTTEPSPNSPLPTTTVKPHTIAHAQPPSGS